ncbi:MAG TPA: prenyltransferase/squalene oxidase repeat-containing protein [Planctomycetota bacterium]|nr:prenyltransferase/squalene oxidase repeat-containing protein [Planctomycetota bacterium]
MRELEPNFERLIRAAELPDPEDRLDAACADFLSRLERPRLRRRRFVPVAAAAVAFAAVLGVILTPTPDRSPGPAPPRRVVQDDAVTSGLRWLVRRQNPDGSWGGGRTALDGIALDKPGVTGVVMLAILGAGYSHLSVDVLDDRKMGEVVESGLRFLQEDLGPDGRFRAAVGALDQALAAEALSEAYGMTGTRRFKDPAQAAIRGLEGLQRDDGSWGDGTTSLWAASAMTSAEISGLEFSAAARERLRAFYARRNAPDADELIVRIMAEKHRNHPAVKAVAEALKSTLPAPDEPIGRLYVRTHAAYLYDGPKGELWEAWNGPFKTSVLPRLDKHGAWAGADDDERIVHTSLATLCLEVYYRYENVRNATPAVGGDK